MGSKAFAMETSRSSLALGFVGSKAGDAVSVSSPELLGDGDVFPCCVLVLPATSHARRVGAGLAKLDPKSIPVNTD